jgi:hypothetical protein
MVFSKLWIFCVSLIPLPSYAVTTATLGGARFTGGDYKGDLTLLDLGYENNFLFPGEPGWSSSVKLSRSEDRNSYGLALSLDQGLGKGYSVGLSGSKTTGIPDEERSVRPYESKSFGGRFGFWLRKNTLRVGVEASQRDTSKEARDFQDTDLARIQIASDAKGSSATIRLTHLMTPTTIWTANFSQTRASGRPLAVSYGGEIRQFVVPIKAAFHLGLDGYTERGEVGQTTDYGRVSANTKTFRYHQRLPFDLIASSTSRMHQEKEIPRSLESETISQSNFSQVFSLRWRYVSGAWTDDASEVGLFGGFMTRKMNYEPVYDEEYIRMIGLVLKSVI